MPISVSRFRRMTAYEKGVAVYLYGCRDDEPNVPPEWNMQTDKAQRDYERGQRDGMMAVIDGDDE